MKSIRELRVTQSYFFFQMLQFVRLQLLFTSEQMRSINRITAASQRGTVGRNNMHSLTSDCGLTRGSALHSLHIVTNTSFAYQVAEKKPQTNGGVQVGTVEHHKGRLPSPPPTRLFYRQLECCQKIFRRHMVSQYLLS